MGGTNFDLSKVLMLTEIEVKRAKPRDEDYKLADANVLYAAIATCGRKTWRWKSSRAKSGGLFLALGQRSR
jgi:hypothetical protein